MTPKQFVARQLELPEHIRVIPDRIYMWENRTDDLRQLKNGYHPYNASDVFTSAVYYENAEYFGTNGAGRHKCYLNGVFNT